MSSPPPRFQSATPASAAPAKAAEDRPSLRALALNATRAERRELIEALLLATLLDLTEPHVEAPPAAQPPPSGPDKDRWLTPHEAARRIGKHPKWLARRKYTLPFIRPLEPEGRGFQISERALNEWMERPRG